MTICTCGRPFNHCRSCGFKAVYRAKLKSASRSMILGRMVDVFTCPRCGSDSDETVECTAVSHKLRRVEIILEDTTKRPKPDSPEYVGAAEIRLKELKEAGLDDEKAIYRMKSEGWVFEEVQPELLVESVGKIEEPPPDQPEITTETILAAMKKQSEKEAKRESNIDLDTIMRNMRKK